MKSEWEKKRRYILLLMIPIFYLILDFNSLVGTLPHLTPPTGVILSGVFPREDLIFLVFFFYPLILLSFSPSPHRPLFPSAFIAPF
jgi:hypothetical protein